VARDDAARGLTLIRAAQPFSLISSFFFPFFSLDPTSPPLALLLISCFPGLRLTIRFRLRALRVSIFQSLPFFFSVLNGRNALHGLFSSLCLFVFSYDPGLQSTIRFRLRALRVSIFPSLPFFPVLNGWIDCSPFYALCFFLVHFCFFFFFFFYSICHCMFWDTSHT
jgi:hypothetical protein